MAQWVQVLATQTGGPDFSCPDHTWRARFDNLVTPPVIPELAEAESGRAEIVLAKQPSKIGKGFKTIKGGSKARDKAPNIRYRCIFHTQDSIIF